MNLHPSPSLHRSLCHFTCNVNFPNKKQKEKAIFSFVFSANIIPKILSFTAALWWRTKLHPYFQVIQHNGTQVKTVKAKRSNLMYIMKIALFTTFAFTRRGHFLFRSEVRITPTFSTFSSLPLFCKKRSPSTLLVDFSRILIDLFTSEIKKSTSIFIWFIDFDSIDAHSKGVEWFTLHYSATQT